MPQLENIEAIERRLWSSADNLRANSNYASNEYFLPVMGLIFLRHAYSRFLGVKDSIVAGLPVRGGNTRELTKEDFSRRGAIFLRPEAQFDYLVSLPDSEDRARAIIDAMESIEADYENLQGILPKSEYQELDNAVLGQILRTFNDPALKQTDGDIFGRIYEYFLTQFANQGAHDNGEFFTPISLVQMIVNVIEPEHGKILDPACGSGGMFVQSAHFIERMHANPTEQVTFYGMEKNQTTLRLAQMNLTVHGLEGNIQRAISYYEDPHELLGKADFVMANPPFNVDEVDADKVKNDPRLPFGLPGVNAKGKVSNGNYLWISYFYSYLSEKGRAGFVMSSQASSAGRDEAKVRQKLIESGAIDVMVAIRSNFFYTRSVPCELWFLDRAKPEDRHDKVLMIDARNIYRQVTRKIYDFSPEQMANLASIVWLYRGEIERFVALVESYLECTVHAALGAFDLLNGLSQAAVVLDRLFQPFLDTGAPTAAQAEVWQEWQDEYSQYQDAVNDFVKVSGTGEVMWQNASRDNDGLRVAAEQLASVNEQARSLLHRADSLYKSGTRLIAAYEDLLDSRLNDLPSGRDVNNARRGLDSVHQALSEHLKDKIRYFYRQAHWLQEHFSNATFRDVPGLCKLVERAEIESNDWILTPGRYVGVAPDVEDEDFDFGETIQVIHQELLVLNDEAAELAAQIDANFREYFS